MATKRKRKQKSKTLKENKYLKMHIKNIKNIKKYIMVV
jgi:hypothetical protein